MKNNHIPRIETATPLTEMRVQLGYTTGQVLVVDLSELPRRFAAFAQLAEPDFFRQMAVADWGHSLEWPSGDGLDAERLMEMALEQQGRVDTLAFRERQHRHRLSLSQAAEAIGMTRRTVSQYRTGARPVPRTVLLALKGWEAEQKQRGA